MARGPGEERAGEGTPGDRVELLVGYWVETCGATRRDVGVAVCRYRLNPQEQKPRREEQDGSLRDSGPEEGLELRPPWGLSRGWASRWKGLRPGGRPCFRGWLPCLPHRAPQSHHVALSRVSVSGVSDGSPATEG